MSKASAHEFPEGVPELTEHGRKTAPPALNPPVDEILAAGLREAALTLRRFTSLTPEDQEDIVQQLGLTFLMRRAAIRRPADWFCYCARAEGFNLLRRRGRENDRPKPESPVTTVIDEAKLDCQRQFISLAPRCRRLLGFLYVQERTLQEVADSASRPLMEIFRLKQRCLKVLLARMTRRTAAGSP